MAQFTFAITLPAYYTKQSRNWVVWATQRFPRLGTRLLSRKTKTIALSDPIHFLPTFVGGRSGNLARDPFELTLCRGLGHVRQAWVACIDLTLEAPVYRIEIHCSFGRSGLGRERPRQIFAASRFCYFTPFHLTVIVSRTASDGKPRSASSRRSSSTNLMASAKLSTASPLVRP